MSRAVLLLLLLVGCAAPTKCMILRTEQDLRLTQQPESKIGACVCEASKDHWRWVNQAQCNWEANLVPKMRQYSDLPREGDEERAGEVPEFPDNDSVPGSL
jgi:hypothetical protein